MWYVYLNNEQKGPVPADGILRLARSGQIKPDTPVWKNGMKGWTPVSSIPELAGKLSFPPPPPPVLSSSLGIGNSNSYIQNSAPQGTSAQAIVHRPTKNCPFCAEEILEQAIKCKHCGEMLNQIVRQTEPLPSQVVVHNPSHNQALSSQAIVEDIKKVLKPKKSPAIAVILSLLIIGAGQFYNGDGGKGAVMFLIAIVLVPATAGFLWLPLAIWSAIDAFSGAGDPEQRW